MSGNNWTVWNGGVVRGWVFRIFYSVKTSLTSEGYRSMAEAERACRRTAKRFGINLRSQP